MIDSKTEDLVEMAKQVNVHEFLILNEILHEPTPSDGSVEMNEILENLIDANLVVVVAYDGTPNCYAATNRGLELHTKYMELTPTQTQRGIHPTMVG